MNTIERMYLAAWMVFMMAWAIWATYGICSTREMVEDCQHQEQSE